MSILIAVVCPISASARPCPQASLDLISGLPPQASIPRDLLNRLDSVCLAEAIVERFARRRGLPLLPPRAKIFPIDLYSTGDIQLQFKIENLDLIEEYGFLNQHQTQASTYAVNYSPKRRKAVEEELIGLSFDDSPAENEILPKYAVLDIVTDLKLWGRSQTLNYGDVVAVFNNDVKRRATYTSFDSLGEGDRFMGWNRHADLRWGAENNSNTRDSNNAYPDFVGTLRDSQLRVTGDGDYIEVQIWGKLGLSDVQEFLVPKTVDHATMERLKKLKKPIYEYEMVTDPTPNPRRIKGRPLFMGCASFLTVK